MFHFVAADEQKGWSAMVFRVLLKENQHKMQYVDNEEKNGSPGTAEPEVLHPEEIRAS
jgi:hypothetical protein